MKLVTVFETSRQDILALAKSMLNSTNLEYFVEGEYLQNTFGLSGIGFDNIAGTIKIKVKEEDKEDAANILKDIKQ